MIPAPPGVVASFTHTLSGKEIRQEIRVVAFTNNGEALLVSEQGGTRLQTIEDYLEQNPGHEFLFLDDAPNPILNLVPGDGWAVERTDSDGSTESTPVIAWALRWDGALVPLTKHSDGHSVEEERRKYRLRHPFESSHRPEA